MPKGVELRTAVRCAAPELYSLVRQHESDGTTVPSVTAAEDVVDPGRGPVGAQGGGLVGRFGVFELMETEIAAAGASLEVNSRGSINAKRHPSGATDVTQCVESSRRLRGRAANHVDRARIALPHNIGAARAVIAVMLPAVTFLEGPVTSGG